MNPGIHPQTLEPDQDFAFSPKTDITAYDLARVLTYLRPDLQTLLNRDRHASLPDDLKRHFQEVKYP